MEMTLHPGNVLQFFPKEWSEATRRAWMHYRRAESFATRIQTIEKNKRPLASRWSKRALWLNQKAEQRYSEFQATQA